MESCIIPACYRRAVHRGMCLICYSAAKKQVERGDTTWKRLEDLGLAKPGESVFNKALKEVENKANEGTV